MILTTQLCPFPLVVNQHDQNKVHQHTMEWVHRFNLLAEETAYQSLSGSNFSWLITHWYPNASLEDLYIISDWIAGFVLILDDRADQDMAEEPDKLATLCNRLLDILKGAAVTEQDDPLAYGLQDIRQRLLQKATSAWMLRFIQRCQECWEAWVWESTNRANGTVPDTPTYIKMRPFTIAIYPFFELIEFAENIDLPLQVRASDTVKQLDLIASSAMAWCNDIISVEKERKSKERHNLVLLLESEHGLTIQEAVERVVKIYNSEVQAFIDLELNLPSFGKSADLQLKNYVSVLRSMIRAFIEWGRRSERYHELILE